MDDSNEVVFSVDQFNEIDYGDGDEEILCGLGWKKWGSTFWCGDNNQ